jgi:hypothetical protein
VARTVGEVLTADERELLKELRTSSASAGIGPSVAAVADLFRVRCTGLGDADLAVVLALAASLAQQMADRALESSSDPAERIVSLLARVAADLAGLDLDTAQ